MRRNRHEVHSASAICYAVLDRGKCIITDIKDNKPQCNFSLSFSVSTLSLFFLLHLFTHYLHAPCHCHVKGLLGAETTNSPRAILVKVIWTHAALLGQVTLKKAALLSELWDHSLLFGLLQRTHRVYKVSTSATETGVVLCVLCE